MRKPLGYSLPARLVIVRSASIMGQAIRSGGVIMACKERLLHVLQISHAVQTAFVAGLSADQRSATGTYENWCARDALAHIAYWIDHRAAVEAAEPRIVRPR